MTEIIVILKQLQEKIDALTAQNKEILNLEEAARYLNISRSNLYRHTSERTITFYRPNGKKIYFLKHDLNQWIMQNKVASHEETQKEASDFLIKQIFNTKSTVSETK